MADFVFNFARGRNRYWYDQVNGNLVQATGVTGPPNTLIYNGDATSQLIIVAIDAGATTDDTLKDFDNLSALLAGTPNEVTNPGYARKVLEHTDLADSAENDTTNTLPLDIPDQTWTGVTGPTPVWTDLLVCWKPTSASADTAIIPMTCHDFAVTPDGTDIVASIAAAGFYGSA